MKLDKNQITSHKFKKKVKLSKMLIGRKENKIESD